MGGIPTNYHGEVVTIGADGNPETVVPGLFAVGEAACVSVHGANRLGSNSLIDLVVFGRAAGHRLKERSSRSRPTPNCPRTAADLALTRLDHFRHAKGFAHGRSAAGNAADHDQAAPCSATMR
jgi:succinate dehydrogenase / fumarate reductase flavoprotein subunit